MSWESLGKRQRVALYFTGVRGLVISQNHANGTQASARGLLNPPNH